MNLRGSKKVGKEEEEEDKDVEEEDEGEEGEEKGDDKENRMKRIYWSKLVRGMGEKGSGRGRERGLGRRE